MIPDISVFDYLIGFIYFFLIFFFAFVYKNKKEETDDTYQYFMPALSAKVIGGFGFLLLSLYYWKGGDTFTYYQGADQFSFFILENPTDGLSLLFTSAKNISWSSYEFANGLHGFLSSNDSFTTVKIVAIINIFCFRSFIVTTIVFSSISFLGVWNMYFAFCKIYPHLKKQLLFAFFFIPSVILWGSGILKDTITIAAIGWLIYGFINIVILKRKQKKSLIIILLATLFIALLKPYILYILFPSLFIWVQSNLKEMIPNKLIRKIMAPFVAIILVVSSFYLSQKLSQNAGKYDINKIGNTLEGFQSWHQSLAATRDQSGYTLGHMELTPVGIFKKIPAAINVTFFRPYLWEVRNSSTLLGAFEGTLLIILSFWLILKYRFRLLKMIFKNKDILFLLIFSFTFAVMVGISSYNFGALSRYKMPAQMFFIIAIILILDKTKKSNSIF